MIPNAVQGAPQGLTQAPPARVRAVRRLVEAGYTEERGLVPHILLFVGPYCGPIGRLHRFVSTSWYEVTGKVSEAQLHAGTRVEAARRWREATSYVERYLAKPEEFPEGIQTGRIWGVWNEELIPFRWETVHVNLKEAFRIRRIYRKLARKKGSGSLRRITVFVRHENVVRLLKLLGYCLE
jgi:hypothetical protein